MNKMLVEHKNGDSAYGTYGHDFASYDEAAAYLARHGGGTIGVYSQDDGDFDCQPTLIDYPQGTYEIGLETFYRMDNDSYAGDVQYVATWNDLQAQLAEAQQIFDDVDEQDFLDSWTLVDADMINDDDRLRDNLQHDIERGIVPDEIAAFINDTLLPDALYDVMTAAEAQQTYRLSESTVRRAIAEGYIRARKSGGTWLIMRRDAQARWGKRRDTREPVI